MKQTPVRGLEKQYLSVTFETEEDHVRYAEGRGQSLDQWRANLNNLIRLGWIDPSAARFPDGMPRDMILARNQAARRRMRKVIRRQGRGDQLDAG